jgi:hypothetical protein
LKVGEPTRETALPVADTAELALAKATSKVVLASLREKFTRR